MFYPLNFTTQYEPLNLIFRLFGCSSDSLNMKYILSQLDHVDFWFNAITRNQEVGDEEYALCWYVPYSENFIEGASEDAFLYGWIKCYTDSFMYCLAESKNAKSMGAALRSIGVPTNDLAQYIFVSQHEY